MKAMQEIAKSAIQNGKFNKNEVAWKLLLHCVKIVRCEMPTHCGALYIKMFTHQHIAKNLSHGILA